MKLGLSLCLLLGLSACQAGIVPISKRGVGGFDKPGTSYMHGRSPGREPTPELYVRHKSVAIAPKAKTSNDGSLFVIDDQRNYLYAEKAPFAVDQFLDVRIVPIQTENSPDATGENQEQPTDDSGDSFVKEMLEALPELDPGEDGGPKLLKRVKMKIAYVYDNGDALAVLKRRSSKPNEGKEVAVRARIPYTALISGREITTQDLVDVHWIDSLDGELTERYSSAWQDEYSLRLSGFNEARSLFARQLEDKRTQLQGVREKLRNQLISLGKERRSLAKQRQEWIEEKAQSDEKIQELETKVEEQEEQIQELQPQGDAPGELRDGADGA